MGTVPWQLIAVEDAEAETIDLKTGATLLGKGQRATPGLDDDNVSRVAARIQVGPGRIHFTSMAHPGFLRITPADTGMARKLVRGQAVLLAMGDMIDMASTTDLNAPSSRFTYMLAEHILESDIQDVTVPGDSSTCKDGDSQPAALPEAHAPTNAQASTMPVATATRSPLGHSPILLAAQDALSTQPYGQLPVLDANIVHASALPPADQGLSPKQTSSPQQPLPSRDVISQPETADNASSLHDQQGPAMPQTSSAIDSVANASGEPIQAPADSATGGSQQLGPTAEDAVQPVHGWVVKADEAMVLEGFASDNASAADHQQPPDQQSTDQHITDSAGANTQHQSAKDAAAMVDTEHGSLSAQKEALGKAEPEPDTPMEEVDKRSAADIFEQTVQDCKQVVEEASSILLNKEAEGAGSGPTSRIAASERATMWHNELQGLLKRCKMPQLYIGVLGDTGAGKSSTINCLLGEENVLPVNGMRACTACVVEISYIQSSIYEGTVECMTREEWTSQATSLWNDLIDERGRLKICRDAERRLNTSSIEGAAQATLETVYGPRTLRRSNMTLEKLLEVNNKITALLGRTINIREHAVKAFRKRIGEYADSHNKKDEIQAWPLVKVCKLRHNWQVLSTGAVVVDLPGVRDANAARGAVAEKYMKSCNAVWIVADITRAVDNRTAKDLLGENFRRQMLMDGQYGSITFICTKTDVIQVSETVRSFSQGGSGRTKLCEAAGVPLEQYEAAQQRVDERQSEYNRHEAVKRRCKKKAKPLNRALVGLRRRLKNCREKIERLEASASGEWSPYQLVQSDSEPESEFDSGDESADSGAEFAPGGKRKSNRVNASSNKRRRRSLLSDADSGSDLELDMSSDDNSDASEEEDEEVVPVPRKGFGPSTLPELQAYAEELQTAIAEKSAIVKTLKSDHREAETQSNRALRKLTQVQLAVTEICGRARNSYSKGVLKKDFKDGLLEMEETAADVELDAEGLQDPGGPSGSGGQQQQRKAKQGEESELPVFCVSAKDCQRIEGRTSKDGFPSAFTKIEYTEIPQLRKHVHHVTEQGRLHAARSLASGLAQFIKTTAATLVHHGIINAELQGACHAAFKIELAKLQAAAQQSLATWKEGLEYECTKGTISPRLNSGADAAKKRAVATQAKWGAHKREGGLYWSTYKATVRPARNGVYKSNSAGEINFNADLVRPILDGISMEWEALFGTTIINRLKQYKKELVTHVSTFLAAVKANLAKLGVDENKLHRIVAEVQNQELRKCTDLLTQVAEDIQTRQRDMSRDVIEPTVQDTMTEAYAACCAEAGPGQFDRMRRLMKSTVERYKSSMFAEAAGKLEVAMKDMVATVAKSLDKAQLGLAARVAHTFTILWERPSCSIKERKAALVRLQELAGQMQPICRGAGAEVLKLTLLEEEDEEQQKADLGPSGHGKHAAVKAEPGLESDHMEEDEEDSDQDMEDEEQDAEAEDERDSGDDGEDEEKGLEPGQALGMSNPNTHADEAEEDEDEHLDVVHEPGLDCDMEVDDEYKEDGEDEGHEELSGELEEDGEDEGEEDEELDNDAMGVEEVPKGTGFDQIGHMMGSGSPATRALHLELAGKKVLDEGGPTAARRATLPPFSTPRPFVKSEPTDDPAPGTAGGPFGAQASIPVMNDLSTNHGSSAAKSRPYSSSALPMSAGFKSAAQHTFQQQLKAEGTRHSTGSLLPLASQSRPSPGSFSWGLPFGVAQPIRGPFAGTVFDPIPRANIAHEETQPTDQADARQAAVTEPKAESKSDRAVVDSVTSVAPTDGVTDVQLAAVNAAAEDKQAAEQFADGAVQSPAAEGLHQPGLPARDTVKMVENAAAEAFLKQGLAADMVQAGTADAAPTGAPDATTADAASTAVADAAAVANAVATDTTKAATIVGPTEAIMGSKTDGQSDVKLPNAEVSVLQAPEATTPAGSASGVKEASTARKSGSQTWFGKAGGILGRWTVPIKVKKEPNSRHRGVTDTIDLT